VVDKSADAKFSICIASVDVWRKELKENKSADAAVQCQIED
jgi:hypothetical protein